MDKIPVAGPHTEGRTLGTDWSISNVAKLLRFNAATGTWDRSHPAGGRQAAANQYYVRKASAKHLPTNVSLIFLQLAKQSGWYASLCFTGPDGYLPWNADTAELWLCALFGDGRPSVIAEDPTHPSVRQFRLLSPAPAR